MKIVPIRERSKLERILYYPEFAYLLPERWTEAFIERSRVANRAAFHLKQLRFSLLAFDRIYLPVGHLQFQPTDAAAAEVQALLAHADFQAIVARDLVLTDAWDASYTSEMCAHRRNYLQTIKWPHTPEWSTQLTAVVERLSPAPRDMKQQSNQLGQDFASYLEEHRGVEGRAQFREIREWLKTATCENVIPFAHEKFVLELNTHAKENALALPVLKATNNLYWDRAEADYGTYVYHVNNGGTPRISICGTQGLPSTLYAPSVMEAFLRTFVGNRVNTLERLPVDTFLDLRRWYWKPFLDSYHELLGALADVMTDLERTQASLSADQIAERARYTLLGVRSPAPSDTLEIVSSLLGWVIGAALQVPGVGPVLRSIAKSHPDMTRLIDMLILRARDERVRLFIAEICAVADRFERKQRARQRNSRMRAPRV